MASIRGIDNLTQEQKELLEKVHRLQVIAMGGPEGMDIVKAWIDEDETLCVRVENGEWYHYGEDITWW